jgi:hypothetical protein
MSQRENSGFNWPRFAVDAGEPVGVGPKTGCSLFFSLENKVAACFVSNACLPSSAFTGTVPASSCF